MRVRMLTTWILLLLWCLDNDKTMCGGIDNDEVSDDLHQMGGSEKLEDALNRNFVKLNDQKTSLRKLYGDILPTVSNFKVGRKLVDSFRLARDVVISSALPDVNAICAGGRYTPRTFSGPLWKPQSWLSPIEDTSSMIAQKLKRFTMMGSTNLVQPVTLLIGDARSGKSVSLAKIHSTLVELEPSVWSIQVDLHRMYPTTESLNEMTFERIVEKVVGPDFSDLFYNLLAINPKKIVILFDGLGHFTDDEANKAIPIIKTVVEKRAIVVLTGHPNTVKLLKHEFNTNDHKIGEMTIQETEQFLGNIWQEKIMYEMVFSRIGPSEKSIESENIEIRLKDYVQAFTHTLFKTPLPRQPVPLMILAEMFKQHSSSLLLSTENAHSVGCLDYVFNPSSSSPALFIAIEHVLLDKNALYENIVEGLRGNTKDLSEHYGVVALVKLIRGQEGFNKAEKYIEYLKEPFMEAQQTLKVQRGSIFINYLYAQQIEFINPEFQYFYAVKYILSHSVDRSASNRLLQLFFENPRYRDILEFINCQVQKLPSPERPLFSSELFLKIMTNVITYGFENLFLYVYNEMLDTLTKNTELNHKFQEFLFSPEMVYNEWYHSKVLGMTAYPRPLPSHPKSLKPLAPIEVLVVNNMFQACETLQSTGVWILRNDNQYTEISRNLLHVAVSRPVPSLELVKFLKKHVAQDISVADLNTLLYDTIDNVGDGCQHIARYLIDCGAQPNSRMDGRTILHAAVKWNSRNLLRYVVEELLQLELPFVDVADNSGRTIFTTALDANASPLYTFPGWWEMMSYLVDHINPASLSTINSADIRRALVISANDINTPQFYLMVLNTGPVMFDSQHGNRGNPMIRPLEWNGYSDAQISKLMHFVPYTSWPVSSDLLVLRRYCWLSKLLEQGVSNVSPLEMLIYYRGARSLLPVERQHYRRAVTSLLTRERESLTADEKVRIYKAFWNNVGDEADLVDCLRFSTVLGPIASYAQIYPLFNQEILRWQSDMIEQNADILELNERLLLTRSKFILPRMVDDGVIGMVEMLHDHVEELNQGGSSRAILHECLKRHRRRDIVFSKDCSFSWDDVDQFNDAAERHVVGRIRVNSDNFLHTLAITENTNPKKAKQLINFVRYLENRPDASAFITGKSQMVVRDLLRHGSLTAYRQNQRFTDVINYLWHPLPNAKPKHMFGLPSRIAALYAASTIPIIRGLYATIQMCLQQHNDTNDNSCWYSSGALALSVSFGPVSTVIVKYTPWIVDRFGRTALDILPSTAPRILRENIKLMRYFGLKYGAKSVSAGLAIAGIGFDLYNIVEMSKMIDICRGEAHNCNLRDEVEYIISLTFSCVSIVVVGGMIISGIGFVPGLLIGLGLLVLEEFAKGINDVVYYSNKYNTDFDENFRIFWHKVGFQPPPADVQALTRRTDWVNNLQQRVTRLLTEGNKNIVAYGVGIGNMVNDGITAGFGLIDLKHVNLENTRGLSRVIPTASENTTLLCLPRQDTTQVYDKYSNNVMDAKYKCENTFVIAHKQRWKTRTSDKSYIIYDLAYVNSGKIVGSDTLNNLFLIYNSRITLDVIGGSGNITNTYMIQNDSFRGAIVLSKQSSKNILYLSGLESPILRFEWNVDFNIGQVKFNNKINDYFSLYGSRKMLSNLHVIGRTNKPESFTCIYNEEGHRASDPFPISIDGGGGQSSSNMDYVTGCKISVIRPFTHIIGSNFPNESYTTHIWLEYSILPNSTTEYATIQPQQSKFIVIFGNFPLLASSYSVKYTPINKTLLWNVQYSASSRLLLSIVSYRSPHSTLQQNDTGDTSRIEAVNCVFIDSYLEGTIYPVINLPAVGISTVTVRHFNIFATVNSSRLIDVISRYMGIYVSQNEMFIVTKLTYPPTGQAFIFGSSTNDRFYIDANTTFLFGGDGSDVYALSGDSPNYVWIQNEATDDALDTLIIPDSCDLLWAAKYSDEVSCDNCLWYDIILFCSFRTTAKSPHINVILRNYLLESRHRHLHIYWRDATYVLLPSHWAQKYQDHNDTETNANVELALFFSFGEEWQTTALTLTNHDTYVVFNGTQVTNQLVAYRSRFDMLLAKEYLNLESSSFVILQDFFSNDSDDITVSMQWQQLKIFSTNNFNDEETPTILAAGDILALFFATRFHDVTHNEDDADFMKEYFVDMNVANSSNTIVIQHNHGSMITENYQLGVLRVAGANPGEFHAEWDHHDSMSLSLCARQSCIIIKDWCRSIRHRLHRMEFTFMLNRRPIVIHDMDQLECLQEVNNNSQYQLLKALNEHFTVAQKQLLLTNEDDDNDDARLMRCIASIFVDDVAETPVYRLFGFSSSIDQTNFIHDNCKVLFTAENLEQLSLAAMEDMLQNSIDKLLLSGATQEEQHSISLVNKRLGQLSPYCWHKFMFSLYNHDNTTEPNDDSSALQLLNDKLRLPSRCIQRIP